MSVVVEENAIPHVQLFVKRSIMDNSHKSSCPICQRWFMVLFLKSEAKELALTVFPVNMKNPEPEFKEYHATPPVVVLVQENVVLTDNLRIEQYINNRFTSLDLSSDKQAEEICRDLYIKFNAYLKAVDQSVQAKERQLLLELKRINDYLESNATRFLTGNDMTLIDCDVMPKLQHIRIAGKVTSSFIYVHTPSGAL
jgi:glutathione S-transferase